MDAKYLIQIILAVVFITTMHCHVAMKQKGKSNKLLLILMDGFRWDYFDQENLKFPGFRSIFREGVRAQYMIPDFPSLSYPNYYSIMTGLHVENHGMVGNFMYDKQHKETFLAGINKEQYHPFWWEDGEPLWVSAEKQNKRVYMYHWPGCEVEIMGVKPTYCRKYNILLTPHVKQMKNAIVEGMKLFKNDSADVVGIYLETADKFGHKYGVNSKKLNHALEDIDHGMTFLQHKLQDYDLHNKVNIMIFSDHGMTNISQTRIVNLTQVINMDNVDVILDNGPTSYLWPKEGQTQQVFNEINRANIPHLSVYMKEDIPERWFYKHHPRIPPILLVADSGWYIVTPKMKYIFSYWDSGRMHGHHGYDNNGQDMRAIFVAKGPDFKKNMIAKPFHNVHLYQIMCHLLNIKAAPNNGSWSQVYEMLRYPPSQSLVHPIHRPASIHIDNVKSQAATWTVNINYTVWACCLFFIIIYYLNSAVRHGLVLLWFFIAE